MFPPFPEEAARKECIAMMHELEAHGGDCDFASHNASLFSFKGMFGALVCLDKNGGRVVLRAFSGSCGGRWNTEGFSPPLFDEARYNQAAAINDRAIHDLSAAPPDETPPQKAERKRQRLALCAQTLRRIQALYAFTCCDGVRRTLHDLLPPAPHGGFEDESFCPLPTGTGDCAAPKLLSEAFSRDLVPVSLAEFYWDASAKDSARPPSQQTQSKLHKHFYPPCDEKCGIILPAILGLKIIYRDEHIIVIEKPCGLLSVPGRGPEKQDCVVRRVQRLFPGTMEQPSVHRLDMDTSGLMVLAFGKESQRSLSMQFQSGSVKKRYTALLDGVPENAALGITRSVTQGRIELRHRVDIENRPRQIRDDVYGKLAVTLWKRERIWNMDGRTVTTVTFEPLTGRTHQLRFASASPLGLNAPIAGDDIYNPRGAQGGRLMLHACYLRFAHPASGALMEFHSEPPFKH